MDKNNKKEKRYVFSFVTVQQVGPDDWDRRQPMFICNEDITVKEVIEWSNAYCKDIKTLTLTVADTEIKEKKDYPF